jgi:hypothetical protein
MDNQAAKLVHLMLQGIHCFEPIVLASQDLMSIQFKKYDLPVIWWNDMTMWIRGLVIDVWTLLSQNQNC